MKRVILVDIWIGELHCQHLDQWQFTDWEAAQSFARAHVEQGNLANILLMPSQNGAVQ